MAGVSTARLYLEKLGNGDRRPADAARVSAAAQSNAIARRTGASTAFAAKPGPPMQAKRGAERKRAKGPARDAVSRPRFATAGGKRRHH